MRLLQPFPTRSIVGVATPRPNHSLPLRTLVEEPSFAVIEKPAGVVTEPGLGHSDDSVMNAAFARWGADLAPLGEARDHGLVHRLDRDTSGALLVARTAAAYDALRAQFEARTVGKRYLAFVDGKPPRGEGVIDRPLEEVRRGDMKVSVIGRNGAGRPARTRWRTVGHGAGRTLLDIELETGRLHQIRAHMAALGCPVCGDRVYRVDLPPNTGTSARAKGPPLALHAWELAFDHPVTGARITVRAPMPASMADVAASSGIVLPREMRPPA